MKPLELARQEYDKNLLDTEVKFLQNANEGQWTKGVGSNDERIRGGLIRWLCSHKVARELVDARGIQINGVSITDLDLEDLSVAFSISLINCKLEGDIILRDADVKNIYLENCIVNRIMADRINVRGFLTIYRSRVLFGISIKNGRISGEIDFSQSIFYPARDSELKTALDLSMSYIGGSVSFDSGRLLGRANLSIVKIGGFLSFESTLFLNKNSAAIAAFHSCIEGSVFLQRSKISGVIDFDISDIHGTFFLDNALLRNGLGKWALFAQRARIKDSISFLCTKITGAVNIDSATVEGDLNFNGAYLNAGKGYVALEATNIRVGGSVLLNRSNNRDRFRCTGELNFSGAQIDGNVNVNEAAMHNKGSLTLNLSSAIIKQSIIGSNRFLSNGQVSLAAIQIQGNINLSGSVIKNRNSDSIDISGAVVKGQLNLRNCRAEGRVLLAISVVNSDVNLGGGVFSNEEGVSIFADRFRVESSVFLDGLQSLGHIRMVNGRISGSLECFGVRFQQKIINTDRTIGAIAFEASFLHIGSSVFFIGDKKAIEIEGMIVFNGSEIGKNFYFSNAEFQGQNESGLDLSNAKIAQLCMWNPSHINNDTFLNLNDASVGQFWDLSTLKIADGQLKLNGFKYERLSSLEGGDAVNLDWLLKRKDQQNPQPFEQLASVLRSNGREKLAKRVIIERERARRRNLPVFARFWNWFLDVSIRYGYRPSRPVILGAVFWIMGVFIYDWGYKKGLYISKNEESKIVPFSALLYSLDSFLPFIDYHQEDARLPNANIVCANDKIYYCGTVLSIYHWIHVTMGWVLGTLFVLSFTNLVRRE